MVNSERRVRITGWENILCEHELPKEYLEHYPNFYTTTDTILNVNYKNPYRYFHIDLSDKMVSIPIESFQDIIGALHKASKRLKKINKKNRVNNFDGGLQKQA